MKKLSIRLLVFVSILLVFLVPVGISISGGGQATEYEHGSILMATNTVSLHLNQAHAEEGWFQSIASWGINTFFSALVSFWKLIIYDLTQVIAAFSGWFLDFFLKHSITSASYRTGIIEAGWEIIRNFVNIIFIFSLLKIAFMKVFGDPGSKANRQLMKTILMALVINFSLYASYLLVDTTNIFAHLFYNRITTEGKASVEADNAELNFMSKLFDDDVSSISTAVVAKFNPQTMVTASTNGQNLTNSQKFFLYTLAGILNIVLITVFFSVALLFLSRTIGIMILVILSPFAVASLAMPETENMKYVGWNSWLKDFMGLSFTAPIFLFFLYLVVTFASNESFTHSVGLGTDMGSFLTNILAVALPFALIATLLLLAKSVTKSLSGTIGGMVSSAVNKTAGTAAAAGAMALTAGAAGLGGLARGAGMLAGGAETGTGRFLQNSGRLLQTQKFDLSKIPGFDKQLPGGVLGGVLKSGVQKSYADVDTAVRSGANKIRAFGSDLTTGRTPESVQAWQDNLQKSNDDLTAREIENEQRKAQAEAVVEKEDSLLIGHDKNGKKIFAEKGEKLEEVLEKKQADRARMSEDEKKEERKRIKAEKDPIEAEIEYINQQIRRENDPAKRKELKEGVEKLKDQIKEIEKSSTDGIIAEIEKQLEKTASDARANFLKEGEGKKRSDTQAARVGGGKIETKPKI